MEPLLLRELVLGRLPSGRVVSSLNSRRRIVVSIVRVRGHILRLLRQAGATLLLRGVRLPLEGTHHGALFLGLGHFCLALGLGGGRRGLALGLRLGFPFFLLLLPGLLLLSGFLLRLGLLLLLLLLAPLLLRLGLREPAGEEQLQVVAGLGARLLHLKVPQNVLRRRLLLLLDQLVVHFQHERHDAVEPVVVRANGRRSLFALISR
mmetsp:Transcript_2218/g.6146  ORF Transcript_2218/g.6146 Transcript_2218/m.6146 type:complete len:206 (-) Transcript_2218:411-1028(-)